MSTDNTIQFQTESQRQLDIYTQDTIQSRIMTIRGHQVIMDADLAEFYQVKTIALNQAVKRNETRFPLRYRFQLTEDEKQQLITNCDRFKGLKHSSYDPSEPTTLHTFERSHDRWLIIDDTVYHFGASLKDLGKRWFSVDIITEHTADELISRL